MHFMLLRLHISVQIIPLARALVGFFRFLCFQLTYKVYLIFRNPYKVLILWVSSSMTNLGEELV